MDQQYPTVAKIPVPDTGKFEQWQFRIQQYLQHEHYALWEVIEFGDSYVVTTSSSSTTTTDTTSDETGMKSGRTVTLTVEDMHKKKNDVMARTTLLLSLPDEHQLRFNKFWKKIRKKISIQGSNVAGFDKSNVECFNCHKMGHFTREYRAPKNQDRGKRDNYRQESKAKEQAPKALMAIDGVGWDWSYMENDEEDHALVADEVAPTEFALMANTSAESKVFDNSLCSKDCTKDAASQEVKKNVSSLTYIALPNWAHDALLEYSSRKPQSHCSTEVPKGSGNPNPTASTSNPTADQIETLTVETPIPTVSSLVPTAYSTDSQEPLSNTRLSSKRVANQEETASLDNILSLINRFEDILGATTNSDKSNRVEADISNMEIAITARDDPIDAINHMMSFLTSIVTSRYPTINNQLRTSSNPRQQATINDGRVTIQPIQGRQNQISAGSSRPFTSRSGGTSGRQR
nr:hypothetical protein [Tanacetum cinerariifolium]